MLAIANLAILAAIAVHAAAGHAAAATSASLGIVTQALHVVAAGVWTGGLAALLTGLRGTGGAARHASIVRFSRVAAVCLAAVLATGILRSLDEIDDWSELAATAYGRVILVKIALAAIVAALGAVNRWRSVPRARVSADLLSRVGAAELTVAAAALAAAAVLGTLAPPAAARIPFISVTGTDFATTTRARLTTGSDQPGPNRFTLSATDVDSRTPVRAPRATLTFTPLDDPGVVPTTLELSPTDRDGVYEGSGANLAFDGRWQVTAQIQRSDAITIPFEIATHARTQFVSIARFPGEKPMFTVEVPGLGHVRFIPDAERPGSHGLVIACFSVVREPRAMASLVVTEKNSEGPVRQLSVRRTDTNAFHTTAEFTRGSNILVATGKTIDGARMRAELHIDLR